jgi:hypothetical protein
MIHVVFLVQVKVNFQLLVELVHTQESIYLLDGKMPLRKLGKRCTIVI